MKRTLTISLWLALGVAAAAQNPAVVHKSAQSAAQTSSATAKPVQISVKPVPATKAAAPKPVAVSAKPAVVNVKPVAVKASAQKPVVIAAKPVAQSKPVVVAAKPAASSKAAVVAMQVPSKASAQVKPAPVAVRAVAVPTGHAGGASKTAVSEAKPVVVAAGKPAVIAAGKLESHKPEKPHAVAVNSASAGKSQASGSADEQKAPAAPAEQSVAQNGRRDPFVSPIVTMSSLGSGCSTGKRCLAIDQINLKGIVKAESGMIAVVVNAAEKAYFLRENDPVFNGYVVKITGDSIVFKETFRDKLGKPLTRDVTKTISRPVA